jgi:hypothetical protein
MWMKHSPAILMLIGAAAFVAGILLIHAALVTAFSAPVPGDVSAQNAVYGNSTTCFTCHDDELAGWQTFNHTGRLSITLQNPLAILTDAALPEMPTGGDREMILEEGDVPQRSPFDRQRFNQERQKSP